MCRASLSASVPVRRRWSPMPVTLRFRNLIRGQLSFPRKRRFIQLVLIPPPPRKREASLVARTDITKHFISRSSLRGALTNLLNAVCDLLVPGFLRAFIGDTIETDQKI